MTDLDAMADILRNSGEYRVQKRLQARRVINDPDGSDLKVGLYVDVETTGLDPAKDEIIEMAMIPFTYSLEGKIFEVGESYEAFNEPSKSLPEKITRLTGITDEMVAGKSIDVPEVEAVARGAALIIAHNAAFDRKFLERLSEVFITKPWACSMTQVDWVDEGHEGTKLGYLAMGAGFFFDGHRAAHDCRAAIELLSRALPKTGELALARLLENARKPSWRIWAENSPFDLKDILKSRGYRWNAEGNSSPKSWYIDVDDDQKESELSFLKIEIYQRPVDLLVRKISAYDRFSDRR